MITTESSTQAGEEKEGQEGVSTKCLLLQGHGLQEYRRASFWAENTTPASGDPPGGTLTPLPARPVSQCSRGGGMAAATLSLWGQT